MGACVHGCGGVRFAGDARCLAFLFFAAPAVSFCTHPALFLVDASINQVVDGLLSTQHLKTQMVILAGEVFFLRYRYSYIPFCYSFHYGFCYILLQLQLF